MSLVLLLLGGGGAAPDRPGGHGGVGWDAGAHGEVGGEGRGKWIGGQWALTVVGVSRQQVAPGRLV